VGTYDEAINQLSRFDIFLNKRFYISDIEEHKAEDIRTNGQCCFNHIIGLPKKNGQELKIFDYEMNLFDALQKHDDIWIKKARGLGVTEILLRYMSWLAVVRNSDYGGKRFHIVTGPRIDVAEELINRIRLLSAESANNPIELKTTGPILYLNNVTIEAFPSHHLDAMRGYTDVAFILVDEGDFFIPSQQEECRIVVEGYRLKKAQNSYGLYPISPRWIIPADRTGPGFTLSQAVLALLYRGREDLQSRGNRERAAAILFQERI
jgi:hypothetical protein